MGKQQQGLTEVEKKISAVVNVVEVEFRKQYNHLFGGKTAEPKVAKPPIKDNEGVITLILPGHFTSFSKIKNWLTKNGFSEGSIRKGSKTSTSVTVRESTLPGLSQKFQDMITAALMDKTTPLPTQEPPREEQGKSNEGETDKDHEVLFGFAVAVIEEHTGKSSFGTEEFWKSYFYALLMEDVKVFFEVKSEKQIKVVIQGASEKGLKVLLAAKEAPEKAGLTQLGWKLKNGPTPANPTFWFALPVPPTPEVKDPEESNEGKNSNPPKEEAVQTPEGRLAATKQFVAGNQALRQDDEMAFFPQCINVLTGVSMDFLSCYLSKNEDYIGVSIRKTTPNKVAAVALIEAAISNQEASGFKELSFYEFSRPGGMPELWFERTQEPIEEEPLTKDEEIGVVGQSVLELVRRLGYEKAEKRSLPEMVATALDSGEGADIIALVLAHIKKQGNVTELLEGADLLTKQAVLLKLTTGGYSEPTEILVVSE